MTPLKKRLSATSFAMGIAVVSFAQAQTVIDDNLPEFEIDRDARELNAQLHPRPDIDVFDTALLFTSYQNKRQTVHCVAFNATGEAIGRARTHLPANGVRLMYASDIARQPDFLGKVDCRSRGQLLGSAYLLGPVINDLKSITVNDHAGSRLRVPIALNR